MGPRITNVEQEAPPAPEAESRTAQRVANEARRRRARGGRARLILSNRRATQDSQNTNRQITDPAPPQPRVMGDFKFGFAGNRGRGALLR